MRCPFCGNIDTQVKDSRPTEDNSAIRRRRFCPSCGSRFTTFERVQLRELVILKRSGRRAPFDRSKLERSLGIALRKRPVQPEQIEQLVSRDFVEMDTGTCVQMLQSANIAGGRGTLAMRAVELQQSAMQRCQFLQQQQALLTGARVVLVQLESPVQTIEAALATAREAGVTTVLNTAPADAPSTIGLLKLADVITPNETEFAALLGRHVGERVDANDVAALDGASLHALCRKLVGNGTVVVTLGSVGVFVSHADEHLRGDTQPYYRVGAEQVQAIDTVARQIDHEARLRQALLEVVARLGLVFNDEDPGGHGGYVSNLVWCVPQWAALER